MDTDTERVSSSHSRITPCSAYSFEQLAEIYNLARVDYIVPMPMNAKRLSDYVRWYDVDLECSFVTLSDTNSHEETGVGMLGVRGDRAWITRLGVIPERRGHKVGQLLADALLQAAAARGARLVQLEVIKGNMPAYNLFLKLGFHVTRELLVIRRPPGPPPGPPPLAQTEIFQLTPDDLPRILHNRVVNPSWIDETASLLNAGQLRGYSAHLPNGQSASLIFQNGPFQLMHFGYDAATPAELMSALLHHTHTEFPLQDTKVENIPEGCPAWEGFRALGYLEVFRRLEMFLYF